MNSDKFLERRLAAILFADIVGYTAMMQSDEGNTMSRLQRYQQVLKAEVSRYHGEIIKNYGDGSLCLFSSVLESVKCARAIQESLREEPTVPLRIGLHLGDVMYREDDVYGNALNISSRIESMGKAGSVLMSKDIYAKVTNQPDLKFESLGFYDFKNVKDSMEIFALANEGIAVPSEKEIGGKAKKKQNKWRSVLAMISAIFVVVAGWSVVQTMGSAKSSVIALEENSIAVLPLKNLNAKDENVGYFADGITQEIIDQLAQISAIKVSAFSISSYYNDQDLSPENMAKELNVKYLISGTSRLLDNDKKVRISITLLNPYTKESLWSQTFDKEMNDAATIQMAIAKEVASTLDISLTPKTQALLDKTRTSSGEAFKLFLLAKSEVDKLTEESLKKSQKLLVKALELDPEYAQAYTLLAWSYYWSGDPLLIPNAISTSKTAKLIDPILEKSMNLDPNSSDAYLVRGGVNLLVKNKIRDAHKDVEKALEINSWPRVPTNGCICVAISTYVSMGNVEKARKMTALAKDVDPDNLFVFWDPGSIMMLEGNYNEAQKLFQQAVDQLDIPFFNSYLGMSIYHKGEYNKALETLEKAYIRSENRPIALNVAYLSNVHFKLGDMAQSDHYLNELKERESNGEHHINQYISVVYAGRNDVQQALNYLEIATNKNEQGMAVNIGFDPIFKILYDEPRFIEIRKGMQYYD